MHPIRIFAALLPLVVACGPSDQKKNTATSAADTLQKMEVVKVLELTPRTIEKNIEFTASLRAFEEVYLVPSMPGRIEKLWVETGSRFRKGDLLVQMDQTQYRQALLQIQNLETDYHRIDTLQQAGSVTRQQFDQISTQYAVAKANIAFLEENTRLRAPFDGVVSGKYFENGEMYSGAPNTPAGKAAIISLVQLNPLKALVTIPETYFPLIQIGTKATVTCDIYPEESFAGEIFRKYPVIDPFSHTFTIEIKLTNPGEKLRPGMFSRVTIGMGKATSLLAPSLAVLKLQGSNDRYVFIERDGVAHRKGVTIGTRFDDLVEIISSDIKAGDQLIVSGQARLVDGVAVRITTE